MLRKNKFSILIALTVLFLSLASPENFNKLNNLHIRYLDKIIHFGMYFFLMSAIIAENRLKLKEPGNLFLIGLITFLFGILMEILQLLFTGSRSASIYDALANGAGIILSGFLWLLVKPFIKTKEIIR